VVDAVGLTACVPPAGCSVYEVPSLPATVTLVALVAVTVKVDELPAAIDVGLALMAIVGTGGVLLMLPPAHPVRSSGSKRPESTKGTIRQKGWPMRAYVTLFVKLFFAVDFPNVVIRGFHSPADAGCRC
jgi:hypothetical protein